MIKLKITKFDKNEKYDEQLENYERVQKQGIWNRNYNDADVPRPYPDKVDSILEVEVTEEQWEAIRKEVLTRF
jgi:hypothetical protein